MRQLKKKGARILIVTATVPHFQTLGNLIAFLVLEVVLVFAFKVSGVFVHGRSAVIVGPTLWP
ncbi:MAG: hypothetical protein HY245_13310 [Rhizobiales bacterium]|nr:hypothetical protein [Hyphomicrobiales bacterium]MBI3674369.1 hypothetical protein [Hyphomicrobiales bacterium]